MSKKASVPEFDLAESNWIHRHLQIRAVTGLVLISLVLGTGFTLRLYHAEARQLKSELYASVALETAVLDSEITRLKNITTQITSRTRIRQELEKYNQGQISLESLAEFSQPKLADAMRLAPDMVGVTRLDGSGSLLIQVGEQIPFSLWPEDYRADTIRLGIPRPTKGRQRLILSAPIINSEGVKSGIDLVAFDYRRLDERLQGFFRQFETKGNVSIAAVGPEGVNFLLTSITMNTPDFFERSRKEVSDLLGEAEKGLHLINVPEKERMLLLHHRIGESDWLFLFLAEADSFFAPARLQALYATFFIIIFTLIGCGLTILAIRPLSGRISVETNTLFKLLQEHKGLLSKIQLSETRLREAQQVAHIGSWELNVAEKTAWWSDEVYLIFGLEPHQEDISYEKFLSVVHPEDRELVGRTYNESVASHSPLMIVHRLLCKDGRIKFVKERGKTIYDEANVAVRSIGTVQDITEQYLQEQEKNRLHAILNALVEGSSDVIFVKDRESRYLLVNQAITKLLERSKDHIIGATDFELFPESLAEQYRSDDQRLMAQQKTETFEEPIIVAGNHLSYLTTKGPLIIDGEIQGVFGISRDISQRKQTEERLRASEESYRGLFNGVLDGILILDRLGRLIDVNKAVETIYGYPRQFFLGKRLSDLTVDHKNNMDVLERSWQGILAGEVQHFELWGSRVRGEPFLQDVMFNQGSFLGQNVIIAVARDISEQVKNQARLARAETEWNQAMDQFEDAIYLLDMQRHLVRANRAFYRMIGGDPDHCVGRHITELVHPDGSGESCPVCMAQQAAREGTLILEPGDRYNPSGSPIEVTLRLVRDDSGAASGMLLNIRDLSKMRQTEERLRLAASVFENTGEGVVIMDAEGNIVEINRAFSEITGYQREEVIGRNPRIWQKGPHNTGVFLDMWRTLKEKGRWRGELWSRRKDDTVFPELLSISSVFDDSNKLTHYVGVFTDISQIKQSQEQLDHLAHHDSLTGLPNRLLLHGRLEQAIRHAERHKTRLAVIFQDLDNFKNINDSFGHPVGDKLLQKVSAKLLRAVRKEDTVARLGGDEFVSILENISRPGNVAVAVEKMMSAFVDPFALEEQDIRVTTSIGISLYPDDGKDVATLLRNADAAMYRAKAKGRNTYQFYTEDMTRNAIERVVLENNLRRAIDEGQLYLLYQPQVALDSQRIIGVEALLRWQHPELGLVSPTKFIPLAEECGLILSIGKWVLNMACQQGKQWLEQGLDFGRIAVNISGIQIQRGNLVEEVSGALAASGISASRLELEVTEGFIMQQAELAILQLNMLRELGVTLSIDDFGTGYSSLSYLKKLPVHKLKIDRSFVRDIPEDPNDMAISDAVIALGKSLGMMVIAEGVETDAQWQFLKAAGCQEGQGYLFGKPLSPELLEQQLMTSQFKLPG